MEPPEIQPTREPDADEVRIEGETASCEGPTEGSREGSRDAAGTRTPAAGWAKWRKFIALPFVVWIGLVVLANASGAPVSRWLLEHLGVVIPIVAAPNFAIEDTRFVNRYIPHADNSGDVRISQKEDGGYHVEGRVWIGRDALGAFRPNLWVSGTKHTLVGRVAIEGYVFESSSRRPLKFKVDASRGYVYMTGVGVVRMPGGNRIQLPR